MPNGWPTPGRPFPDEYHDERPADQLVEDLRNVRKQVGYLGLRERDEPVRRQLLSRLQTRMQARDEPMRMEQVPSEDGSYALVVAGELLIRAEQLEDPRVDQFLHEVGFERNQRQDLPGPLGGRVVRLVAVGMEAERRYEIVQFLGRQGVEISMHHVTTLGQIRKPTPVGKALTGPKRTRSSVRFRPRPRNQIRVAVIDTGMAEQDRDDKWLQNADVPVDDQNRDPVYHPAFPEIGWGEAHGYSVAGIVQQVETGAFIRVYRALNRDGIGTEADVADAMVQAVVDGAQIINLSLGAVTVDDKPPLAYQVALEAIEEIERQTGNAVVVIAAAGNYGTSRAVWPAAHRRVVSVGALAADGRPASWSSRGFWVTCSAVGEGVLTPYVEGDESWERDPEPDRYVPPNPWAVWSGSSFAAPQIAGAVARLCTEDGGRSPQAALRELLSRGRYQPDYGQTLQILLGT